MDDDATLEAFVRELYARMNDSDGAAFDRLIASGDGVLGIGTDPDEWWDGAAALRDAFTTQTREMREAGMAVEPREVRVWQSGDVGWFADRPRIRLADGSRLDTRVSGVCRRQADGWALVHWHISVGVPNEDAVGQELTIA